MFTPNGNEISSPGEAFRIGSERLPSLAEFRFPPTDPAITAVGHDPGSEAAEPFLRHDQFPVLELQDNPALFLRALGPKDGRIPLDGRDPGPLPRIRRRPGRAFVFPEK
jgi:hypothetical protein